MAASRTKLWILISGVAALSGAGYYFSRPNWRTISEAEFKAVLDPELVALPKPDKAAQARYTRLNAAADRLQEVIWIPEPSTGLPPATKHQKVRLEGLREIDTILREGPTQKPYLTDKPTSAIPSVLSAVGQQEANRTLTLAKEGRRQEAVETFLRAFRLVRRLPECGNAQFGAEQQCDAEEELGYQLGRTFPYLSEKDLATIAAAIPSEGREDPGLRQCLLEDFRGMFLPMFVDPVGAARRAMPTEDPQRLLSLLCEGTWFSEKAYAVPTYDALETAKMFDRAFTPTVKNTMRPFAQQDGSGHAYAKSLSVSMPTNHMPGKTGYALKLAELRYRLETARIRNALGTQLVRLVEQGYPADMMETSFYRRTHREALRARIALRRYQLRFGHPAPSLAALVEAGLLDKPPLDVVGTGDLRYDPKRGVIWSVGKNQRDDGGKKKGPAMKKIGQPDWVWSTR